MSAAALVFLALSAPAKMDTALAVPNPRVLVFSKTAGFRHDSIPTGIETIRDLAKERGFQVYATEEAQVFTPGNLGQFDCVVFLNTTGDVLNDDQQKAFEAYIRSGGGYVGVHSATDTEYGWPWYGQLAGAYFRSHPQIQKADIRVEDRAHPTTCHLPNPWTRTDEWYDFRASPRPNVRVLANLDETTYKGGLMGADHPIVWCHEFQGGRAWYTALGHTKETYAEPLFRTHLAEGILWAANAKLPEGTRPLPLDEWHSKGWNATPSGFHNGQNGPNLASKDLFDDLFVSLEFKVPKGGNSGVYLMGRYEIQILDSHGVPDADLKSSMCGSVYERWKDDKGYEGKPPLVNAARPAGEWNRYDMVFRAPRFRNGTKTENARFVEVRLNGVVVQRNVEVTGPTRAAMFEDEKPAGTLMLQGDHGPVEYRNVRVKPLRL